MRLSILLVCAAIVAYGKEALDVQDVLAYQTMANMQNGNNAGGANPQLQQEMETFMMMNGEMPDASDMIALELMGGLPGAAAPPYTRQKFRINPTDPGFSTVSKQDLAAINGEEELMNYIASESLANGGSLSPVFLQTMLDGNYLQNELQNQLIQAGVDPYNLFGVEDQKLALALHTLQKLEEAGVTDPFALNTILEGKYIYLKSIMMAINQGASPILAKDLAESKYQQFQTLQHLEETGALNSYYVTLFGGEDYAAFKAMNKMTEELVAAGVDRLTAEQFAFQASKFPNVKQRGKQQGMPENMMPYMMMQSMQGGAGGVPGMSPPMGGMGPNPMMMNPYFLQSDMMETLSDLSMKDMATLMPMMSMMQGGMGGMPGGMPGMNSMMPPQPPMRGSIGDNVNDMFETMVDKPWQAAFLHNMMFPKEAEAAEPSPGFPGFMGNFNGPGSRGSMIEGVTDAFNESPLLTLGVLGLAGMGAEEEVSSMNNGAGSNYPNLAAAEQWVQSMMGGQPVKQARGSPMGMMDNDMMRFMLLRNLLGQDQTEQAADPTQASIVQNLLQHGGGNRGSRMGFFGDYLEMGDGGLMNIALLDALKAKMNPQAAAGTNMRGNPLGMNDWMVPFFFIRKMLEGQQQEQPTNLRGLTSLEMPFEWEMMSQLMGGENSMNPFMGSSGFGAPSGSTGYGGSSKLNALSMMQMAKLLSQIQKNGGFGVRGGIGFNPLDQLNDGILGKFLLLQNVLNQNPGPQAAMRGNPAELFDNNLWPLMAWQKMKPEAPTPEEQQQADEKNLWMLLPDPTNGGLAWKIISKAGANKIANKIQDHKDAAQDAAPAAPVGEDVPVVEDAPVEEAPVLDETPAL